MIFTGDAAISLHMGGGGGGGIFWTTETQKCLYLPTFHKEVVVDNVKIVLNDCGRWKQAKLCTNSFSIRKKMRKS